MRILGVWLQPPNSLGIRDWLLGRAWKNRLSVAGIDPERIEIFDETKLCAAIKRIQDRQAEQERENARRREIKAADCSVHITEPQFDALTQHGIKGWYSSPPPKG
jgi:hypothetical protein